LQLHVKFAHTGWHKKLAHFLYALTSDALTLSNIDRFSNLFHIWIRSTYMCVITLSLKIPPHLKCVATLLC